MAKKKVAKKTTKKAAVKKKAAPKKKYDTSPKPIGTLSKSVCAKCGSTDRTAYNNVVSRPRPDGELTVWRRTSCAKCGQARIDRSIENP